MGTALSAQGITGETLIEMRDIFKIFKTGAGDFTALNGVDVCFYEGEFVSVVGKSGSGKSTLVNMLTGIDHPTSGSVRVGDTYIHQHSEGQMSIWRGANLGIIFHGCIQQSFNCDRSSQVVAMETVLFDTTVFYIQDFV